MFGAEPQLGGTKLGTWAVLGFFAISGFLITGSRMSGKSAFGYYVNRVMRIVPAFVVCLVIVAFVFAPLSLIFDPQGSWSIVNSVTYFLRNLPLYPPELAQPAIGQTLQHVPYRGYWNGSMWTLFWEFSCYIFIGCAVSLSRRLLPAFVAVVFLFTTGVSLAVELGLIALPDLAGRAAPLIAAFAAGSLAFLFRDRVRFDVMSVGAAIVAIAAVSAMGVAYSLAAIPLTVILLWLGAVLPLSSVGTHGRADISYGMYIYAWPVQQILMLLFGKALGLPGMVVLSIASTIPLAYLSYRLIEKPAQERGRVWAKKYGGKRAAAPAPDPLPAD